MKKIKSFILVVVIAFTASDVFSQANPSVAILPLNPGGLVDVGAVMDIKVTINNTLAGTIAAAKLRPVITIPAIATILASAEQTGLPAGWIIVSNASGQIRVCNSADPIGGNEQRDIIIKVQGTSTGGPTQCQVQLNFGGATCSVSGPQPTGNITVDDFATSSVTVSGTVPLNLLSFNATLLNCQPSLNWTTASEINTDRFEIERGNLNNLGWTSVGTLRANGNINTKSTYSLTDRDVIAASEKVLYRLKIIDKNGSYKYSDVLPVLVNCKTVQVQAYPNPVQDGKLYVSVTGTGSNTNATLLSVSGQVILRTLLNNGTNIMNVAGVASGSYVLSIKDMNGVDKKVKVIIQH